MENKLNQEVQFELTNIGAWFSANLKVDTYVLTERETGKVSGVIKINKYNYTQALQILMDYMEQKYGPITKIWYEDDGFVIACLRTLPSGNIPIFNPTRFLRLNAIKEKDIVDFTKENTNGSTLGN